LPTLRTLRAGLAGSEEIETAHLHVTREKKVAKFWLDPVMLQKAGGFSRHELDRIARLVDQHQQHLMESWYEFFGD
jgi:hypothetical protein